jgi:hypothetical protein
MNTWRKETTTCQEETKASLEKTMANPGKTKADQEDTEVVVDVFEEWLNKMYTMNLKANRDNSDALAKH